MWPSPNYFVRLFIIGFVCSLLNYSALDGRMFCKPHFLEMFKTKGTHCFACARAGSAASG